MFILRNSNERRYPVQIFPFSFMPFMADSTILKWVTIQDYSTFLHDNTQKEFLKGGILLGGLKTCFLSFFPYLETSCVHSKKIVLRNQLLSLHRQRGAKLHLHTKATPTAEYRLGEESNEFGGKTEVNKTKDWPCFFPS